MSSGSLQHSSHATRWIRTTDGYPTELQSAALTAWLLQLVNRFILLQQLPVPQPCYTLTPVKCERFFVKPFLTRYKF